MREGTYRESPMNQAVLRSKYCQGMSEMVTSIRSFGSQEGVEKFKISQRR